MKSVLIIAGEASGDMHAAPVLRNLKRSGSDLSCWGIGGPQLRDAGMELLHDVDEMDVLGFAEVIKRYSFFKAVFNEVLSEVDRRKPDAALLIDYPGFNLRLAKELKKRGIKVLYYICPQVWAWKKDRIQVMADVLDRLMVIFPFEVDVFKGVDLRVDFVGHPMVDDIRRFRSEECRPLPWTEGKKIALLPGSREQEIRRILPALLKAAVHAKQNCQIELSFIIAVPANREELVEAILREAGNRPQHCVVVIDQSREVLKQADAALVASGTATLEAALLHCPTVLVYKTSALTYAIARYLINIPWLGIVNIISGREVMPERIQSGMKPKQLAADLERLIHDIPLRDAMIENFKAVEEKLGQGEPASRVAQILCDEVGLPGHHDRTQHRKNDRAVPE
jgi:lipid-A-disaccharide synthase